jgi:type I restriction enzyme R subunit
VSYFAFTATPKPKTLELFGTRRPDGSFEAFSLYSMRQAIEEKFILDVLDNYTTYKSYWRLLKRVAEDPRYEKDKAYYLLRSFVDLHDHAIRKKVEIMVEHFHDRVAGRIGGNAKAMVVTRSRLHAVRFKLAIDQYLKERGYPYLALVAFSGTVRDEGVDYTEPNMNTFPEAQTAKAFEKPEYRFLIVANKFQTGFDRPLLHTMYVDKKLGGVNAIQTLSRLNRTHLGKEEAAVLDFANDAEAIREAFQPYYEKTILSEATDPNLLYDLERKLAGDRALAASVRVNTPENARLTFDHVVTDRLQEMVDTNFKFYKRVTNDREFARFFVDWLFERFRKSLAAQ